MIHCTRARFTGLVLHSDELAVHLYPLLCLHRQVAKAASRLFYCLVFIACNNMAANLPGFTSYYVSRGLLHVTAEHRHLGRCIYTVYTYIYTV